MPLSWADSTSSASMSSSVWWTGRLNASKKYRTSSKMVALVRAPPSSLRCSGIAPERTCIRLGVDDVKDLLPSHAVEVPWLTVSSGRVRL